MQIWRIWQIYYQPVRLGYFTQKSRRSQILKPIRLGMGTRIARISRIEPVQLWGLFREVDDHGGHGGDGG